MQKSLIQRHLTDLRDFPVAAKREAGLQIYQVQNGLDPDDWKPMPTMGAAVGEIRIQDAAGAFRDIAKFSGSI